MTDNRPSVTDSYYHARHNSHMAYIDHVWTAELRDAEGYYHRLRAISPADAFQRLRFLRFRDVLRSCALGTTNDAMALRRDVGADLEVLHIFFAKRNKRDLAIRLRLKWE